MKTCFRLTGISVLASAALLGQGVDAGMNNRVRGEISPLPPATSSLTVELSGSGSGPSEAARVAPDGTFEFRSGHRGACELRIVDAGGAVIHREAVMLTGSAQLLSVRISDPSPGLRSTEGTVSMRQLSHKIPPGARKAFDKGQQAENKGQYDAAADLFRQAASIDPEYADAFNELGAMEAKQGNLGNAVQDFQKAIDVVPEHSLALANLSIVLAKLRRFDEAAAAARRALRVMPGSGTQMFILATSLLLTTGDSDEVLENFERSASEVPRAHLVAAELLVERGKRAEAARHVQDYLRTAPADARDREKAEAMLVELRRE
jgi:tetratricopeptide (TPR) repeat protein